MFWLDASGRVNVDSLGRPIDCPDCPCGGFVDDGGCFQLGTCLWPQTLYAHVVAPGLPMFNGWSIPLHNQDPTLPFWITCPNAAGSCVWAPNDCPTFPASFGFPYAGQNVWSQTGCYSGGIDCTIRYFTDSGNGTGNLIRVACNPVNPGEQAFDCDFDSVCGSTLTFNGLYGGNPAFGTTGTPYKIIVNATP